MSFKQELMNFCERYSINVSNDNWEYVHPGQAHEISESLFSLFEGVGVDDVSETGCPPSDFLPSMVDELIEMVEAPEWKVIDVRSEDNWNTSDVDLESSSGATYSFKIKDVNDEDWVPVDIFDKVNAFAKQHGKYSVSVFFSDDPYRVIALDHEAAEILDAIVEKHTTPYY